MTDGGLICSAGGWAAVKDTYRELSVPGSEMACQFNRDRSAVAKILKELICKN
jgi:hypothetical protein